MAGLIPEAGWTSVGITVRLMSERRRIAGNWCAEKKNQGKFPCLSCKGRGTVLFRDGIRRGCKVCKLSGWATEDRWVKWLTYWGVH